MTDEDRAEFTKEHRTHNHVTATTDDMTVHVSKRAGNQEFSVVLREGGEELAVGCDLNRPQFGGEFATYVQKGKEVKSIHPFAQEAVDELRETLRKAAKDNFLDNTEAQDIKNRTHAIIDSRFR